MNAKREIARWNNGDFDASRARWLLARTRLTDEMLAGLKGLQAVRLVLAGNPIEGRGLQFFREAENLRELSLSGPEFKNATELAGLTQLESLSLTNTEIGDAGIGLLQSLKKLKALKLEGSKVTAAGVAALRAELPDCKISWDGE